MEVIPLGSPYVNWYLLRSSNGAVIIDTGFAGYFPQLEQALENHQIGPEELKAVLLTHVHNDHIGCAEAIRSRFQIPVYLHEADAPAAQKISHSPPWWAIKNSWRWPVIRMIAHAIFTGKTFATKPLKEVITFTDDDELPVPGKPLVIHTPGHTLGESCFYFREAGLLFSGDALVTKNVISGVEGGPQLLHDNINEYPQLAKDSLTKLGMIGGITLYPGHGLPWEGNLSEVFSGKIF
ncbi:MAG TPA: MBL fold metallo-hydrolase [Fluviicola sp.]|nr:MBL fold metallo-hydrolase [Fluviicola sp.]